MLKAVTFDCWQTLILDRPEGLHWAREGRVHGIHEALFREGLMVNAAAVAQAYDTVGVRLEEIWATRRDVGSRGQVRLLLKSSFERCPRWASPLPMLCTSGMT